MRISRECLEVPSKPRKQTLIESLLSLEIILQCILTALGNIIAAELSLTQWLRNVVAPAKGQPRGQEIFLTNNIKNSYYLTFCSFGSDPVRNWATMT